MIEETKENETEGYRCGDEWINGQDVEAIIDSGMPYSLVSQHVVRKSGRWDDIIQAEEAFVTARGNWKFPLSVLKNAVMKMGIQLFQCMFELSPPQYMMPRLHPTG